MKKELILIISKNLPYSKEEEYEKKRDHLIEELEEKGYIVDIEAENDADSAELEFEDIEDEDF